MNDDSPVRIRLVEDDVDIAVLFRHVLRGADVAVTVDHRTTTEGLYDPDVWRDVDVAVCDVMLGGSPTNGADLAVWVAEHTDTRPFIVTAAPLRDTRAADAAGVPVLLKPVPLGVLLDTVLDRVEPQP